jgi:RNA polymerase sigma-70 factor (ECF subfamily)
MIESRLVRKAQGGDRGAMDRLLRQELSAVRQAVCRVLGHDSELDDVTQQVLIEAVRSLHSFRGDSQIRTWITRIAIRTAWTHVRTRRKIIRLTSAIERMHACRSDQARTESRSELGRIERCLHRLPAEQRVVFVLRDIEGYTTGEIARLLEIPDGTVSTRLRSARTRIRDYLSRSASMQAPGSGLLQRLGSNGGGRA